MDDLLDHLVEDADVTEVEVIKVGTAIGHTS